MRANAAGSLAPLVQVPAGAELAVDPRDVAFLAEDQKDAAEIVKIKASTMGNLIINGYDPDSVTNAVNSGDLAQLKHTGLVSVQLQEPGTTISDAQAAQNGSGTLPTLPSVPKGRFEELEDEIRNMTRREQPPPEPPRIDITIDLPEIRVEQPDITVEAPEIVFPADAIRVEVDAMPKNDPPVVNVTVEPAEVTVVERPRGKKTVEFGDGRTATVTEEDTDGAV